MPWDEVGTASPSKTENTSLFEVYDSVSSNARKKCKLRSTGSRILVERHSLRRTRVLPKKLGLDRSGCKKLLDHAPAVVTDVSWPSLANHRLAPNFLNINKTDSC